MKNDNLLAIVGLCLMFVTGVCIFQQKTIIDQQNQLEKIDTIVKHDTVYKTLIFNDTITKYKQITKLKTDTIYSITGDTLKINLITKEFEKILTNNQDTIQYKAYVTGRSLENEDYPTLDAINIKTNTKVINTTTIIEKPIPAKKKLFSIRPEITPGYDLVNKQWGITAGIGLGINF